MLVDILKVLYVIGTFVLIWWYDKVTSSWSEFAQVMTGIGIVLAILIVATLYFKYIHYPHRPWLNPDSEHDENNNKGGFYENF